MRGLNYLLCALLFCGVNGLANASQVTFDHGVFSGTNYSENGVEVSGNLQVGRVEGHGSAALTFANGADGDYQIHLPLAFNILDFDVVANMAAYGAVRMDWYLAGSNVIGLSLFVGAAPGHIHFAGAPSLDFDKIVVSNRVTWCDRDCNPGMLKFGGVVSLDNVSLTHSPISPVPEPETCLLLLAGLATLGLRRCQAGAAHSP